VSANIHASATVTRWSGTDFNPAQAGFAQALAEAGDNGAKLYDQSFEEFANRTDLPDFDFIGLHGIWSWISDENREIIVDFIRRKLKVGGVLYVSYNTQPGWAAMVPMRELMTEHSEVMGAPGLGIVPRIDGALKFVDQLMQVQPSFAKANPVVIERLKKLKEQSRNYLAHEYFNRDWVPMSFSKMGKWLEGAKVTYAASANYLDYVDAINLTAEQQALLKDIPSDMFRQTVRDFMVNLQFRKDYWVKGPRKLTPFEQLEGLRSHRVLLVTHRAEISLKVTGSMGEATLSEAIYVPILDILADHKIKSLSQLEQGVREHGINFVQLLQALLILVGSGHVVSAQDELVIPKCRKQTEKINTFLIGRSRSSADTTCLASPVTGGGMIVSRVPQLFLLAITLGRRTPDEWVQVVWQILTEQGQKMLKDGKALETKEENIAELTDQAAVFAKKLLPIFKALQIV
jgi:SAM-dependent methyltransferase